MKKLITIFAALLMTASVFAQAPEKMSYQAVIRNSSDALVTNSSVGMRISILQGSSSGSAIYVETQTPTSNANGLVSLEIGGGTVISGTFASIDWANGPFFIKTETDPNGGTSYSITGTSQLLSVPYALYAKSSGSYPGPQGPAGTNGTDGADGLSAYQIWLNLGNSGSEIDFVNSLQGPQGVPGQDGSTSIVNVGDFKFGGIVIWVDQSGQHGLVCSKSDVNSALNWSGGTNNITVAKGNGIYSGNMNTSLIISKQGLGSSSTYAALSCSEYISNENGVIYGDWYLPSKDELNIIYTNKAIIDATSNLHGGTPLSTGFHWSSTESDLNNAWNQGFINGFQSAYLKSTSNHVRAVRRF